MYAEITILKEIPTKNIKDFEKKVIYNVAVYTREYTKGENAFPYLTGKLQSSEVATPIQGSGMEYSLTSGVDYAKYVWKYTKAKWTNSSTQPQWYFSVFQKNGNTICNQAVSTALKEV